MKQRDPERLSEVLKRVVIRPPESWHDIHIVMPDDPPQLDLFGNPVATPLAVTHSKNRKRGGG